MGLFGNNDYKIRVELAQEMAHNANDANKEIGEIMGAFDRIMLHTSPIALEVY